ncbi:DNA-binding response regulator [Stenotrophomonas lactitubi]|uniref:response regulator transcription factor n=1 Tax=Stenotrophomonas lactitubi TaxID=2045214 RepID=UPI000C277B00|nr:response regulator transcription factor [Stenotrophomonas lactitubi]PJO54011.1 DNA-binding response regulator [Stenotrophomonas lactitubi]
MKILIIDCDQATVSSVFNYMEPRGHLLDVAREGTTGLHLATSNYHDALIIGWADPQIDGPGLVRTMRQNYYIPSPALMLTERAEVSDKVRAFRSGADDYLTKPFEPAELEVRLEALVARSRGTVARNRLVVGDLTLDLSTLEVSRAGRMIHLYPACRKLLHLLMLESPAAVSRERLEYAVWASDPPDLDLLRSQISSLRQSIDRPFEEKLIQTVPRFGYRLAAGGNYQNHRHQATALSEAGESAPR